MFINNWTPSLPNPLPRFPNPLPPSLPQPTFPLASPTNLPLCFPNPLRRVLYPPSPSLTQPTFLACTTHTLACLRCLINTSFPTSVAGLFYRLLYYPNTSNPTAYLLAIQPPSVAQSTTLVLWILLLWYTHSFACPNMSSISSILSQSTTKQRKRSTLHPW